MNSSNFLRLQKAKTKEASWVDLSIRLSDLEYLSNTLLLDREAMLRKQFTDTLADAIKDFDEQ